MTTNATTPRTVPAGRSARSAAERSRLRRAGSALEVGRLARHRFATEVRRLGRAGSASESRRLRRPRAGTEARRLPRPGSTRERRGLRRAGSSRELRRLLRDGRGARRRVAFADDRGQSALELVLFMPVLVALAIGLLTLLAAARAREDAAQAAEAGAVALLHDGDPRAAACAALGRSERCRGGVQVRGRRITVTLRPHGPFHSLNRALEASKTADAGPGAAP